MEFTQLNTKSRPSEIEEQLLSAISERKLKPGDRLPSERELTEVFNVSRATVREALLGLRSRGLIYIKRGMSGGAFLSELNADAITQSVKHLVSMGVVDYSHIMELRLFIEPETSRIAALKSTEEDILELENFLKTAEENITKSPVAARFANNDFHAQVAQIAGNPLIIFITESITQALSKITIEKTKMQLSTDEISHNISIHREILSAIKDNDPDMAYTKTKSHLLDVFKFYNKILAG